MNPRAILWALVLGGVLIVQPPMSGNSALGADGARVAEATRPRPSSRPATEPASRPAATAPATAPAAAPNPGTTLEACHRQYMTGQYSSAASGYRKLMSAEAQRLAAAVGAAQALEAQGNYSQAREALDQAGPSAVNDAPWHLQYAQVLWEVGEYEKALDHCIQADRIRPDYAPTIFARGQLLETLGRKKEAAEVYKSMQRVIVADQYRKDAPSLVALGKILDRDAVLSGKKASEQAQNILQNYFQEAYQKVDAKYWPANVAAGLMGLAKHRPDIARTEFQLARRINPRIGDIHVGMGAAMLEEYAFEPCMGEVKAALAINPNHADALLLKALCFMQWRKFDEVPAILDKILKVNPNHLDALSLYAAVHIRMGEQAKAQPYIDRVHKVNATYSELPNTVGQWLAAGRQFEAARKYYQEAIQLAPEQADPLTNLGLLYMQTGQETLARETLTQASKIDDYRADVINYLNLLDRLDKFEVRETEHFIIKVNGETDAILLDQVAAYAEEMYSEVCDHFDYHPAEKSIVEFFPTHQQFSVRITGKGWIGTVGASTGRVIAMVAPSPDTERTQFGPFNWSTVLRHEFTHTVTLAKTNNRIPHWFTEACAVWEQPDRRNYEATQALVVALRTGHLFAVKELDWSFIRPKLRGDRELAYAQSEWIMEYLIATKSFPIIVKMLEAFRDGQTQTQVFGTLVGTSETDFDKAFLAWAKDQVEQWGFESTPLPNPQVAQKEAAAKPGDAAAQSNLAMAMLLAGNLGKAETAAKAALKIDPSNKRALSVLANVQWSQKKPDEALATARKLEEVDHQSKTAPRIMAQAYMEKRRWAQAIEVLELMKLRAPLDEFGYENLATCYLNIGQPQKALPNLIELHKHAMNTPKYARRIAETYRSIGQDQQALEYYRQVIRINPYETSAYQAIASIQLRAKKYDESVKAAKDITLLTPQAAEAWFNLAKIEYFAGRARQSAPTLQAARRDAKKSISMDSSDPQKELLEKIDQALEEMGVAPATREAAQGAEAKE